MVVGCRLWGHKKGISSCGSWHSDEYCFARWKGHNEKMNNDGTSIQLGFPKIRGTILGGPHNKEYSKLGPILGSPHFGKLPGGHHPGTLAIRLLAMMLSIGV